MTKLTYTREGNEFAVEVETLPAAAIAYLLQYGFAQSLQDSIAGLAKKKESDLRETDAFKAGDMTGPAMADEISLAIFDQLTKRTDAILAGTIGTRAPGQPKDELSSLAREQVKAALAKKGVKVEKDKLAELVAAHVEKNGDKLRAEIVRRKESVVEIEIEL